MTTEKVNKVKLNLNKFEQFSTISILSKSVQVSRVIGFEDAQKLIINYLHRFFNVKEEEFNPFWKFSEFNRFLAEGGLRSDVLSIVTDLDVVYIRETNDNVIFSTDVYEKVIEEVSNWNWFRNLLDSIVEDVIHQMDVKSSVGVVIDTVVGELATFLDEVGDGGLEKLTESVKEAGKAISESRLSPLLDEAEQHNSKE